MEERWWLSLIIGGPIVAWVGSWILYAFGELVEDVHALRYDLRMDHMNKNVQLLATSLASEKKAEPEKQENGEHTTERSAHEQIPTKQHMPVKNESGDTYWICGKCSAKNLRSRNDCCWLCGNPVGSTPTTPKTSETPGGETGKATALEAENDTIVCSECKCKQPAGRTVCWHCGVKFENI